MWVVERKSPENTAGASARYRSPARLQPPGAPGQRAAATAPRGVRQPGAAGVSYLLQGQRHPVSGRFLLEGV